MSRHVGKVARKMQEQAGAFFSGRVTEEDRKAAMKKLHSYPAPLKDDWPVSEGEENSAKVLGVEAPVVPSYRDFPLLRKKSTRFRSLIERHNLLRANMELLASEQASLRGEIQLVLELSGQKSVLMDAIMVTRTEGRKPSEKVDRKKITKALLKRGIAADEAATIVASSIVKGKPGRPSIVITDTSKPRGRGARDENRGGRTE